MFDFVALDGHMRVKVFRSLSKNSWSPLQQEKETLLYTQQFILYTSPVWRPPLPGKGKKNQTPSQDIPSGMFTPNYSVGMCYPTSFLNRLSILESLHSLHLDFVFSLSTLHLFGGCGSNMSLEYLLSKQCEEERKLLSPTRKLDNGIRCLCFFH